MGEDPHLPGCSRPKGFIYTERRDSMNTQTTRKTAILVDGGYYRRRAIELWGKSKTAAERAEELYNYCFLHLTKPTEPRDLYRIFYYDCPPMMKEMTHPLTGEIPSFRGVPDKRPLGSAPTIVPKGTCDATGKRPGR